MLTSTSRAALRWAHAAAFNLAVLCVLCLGFEAGTRVLGLHYPAIGRPGPSERGLWRYDRTKGWFYFPGSTGAAFLGGPDQGVIRINSLGLRGPEIGIAKTEGWRRILVFGDSFVFGHGVDEKHLFVRRLEAVVNAGSHGRYQAVNMGVSGYSTDQEYLLMGELGVSLAPDIVILVVCDNDFEGNLLDFAYLRYYKPYFELAGDGALSLRNSPVPQLSRLQRLKLWLAERSNLWNAIRSRRSGFESAQKALAQFQVGTARPNGTDPVLLMFRLLESFRELSQRCGAAFVVLNTGHRGEQTKLFQDLRPRLRRAGFQHLGLEEELGRARAEVPDGHWDFGLDPHWNIDAHQRAAEIVAEYLKRRGLV